MRACGLLVAALMILTIQPANSAEITKISVKPREVCVENGEVFEVQVVIDPAAQVAGYQFSVGYDSAVVDFLAAREGEFFKKEGFNTYFYEGWPEHSIGILRNVTCVVLGQGGCSKSGTLAVLRFRAKGVGESSLTIFDVVVGDPSGQSIEVSVQGGRVRVVREGAPAWLTIAAAAVVLLFVALLLIALRRRGWRVRQFLRSRAP